MPLTEKEIQALEKKGYRFAGKHKHAAAKVCHWTKKSLLNEGVCYKEKFYGIESHRCLQMSPSIPFCQQQCSFCWRDISITKTVWDEDYDEPGTIIDECIDAQKNLLCGFFGNAQADKKKLKEAQEPRNAAISLAGEPMLYPKINEMISEFNRRDFTTFLVTNGMTPLKLENIEKEPTQLYISLDAPNKEVYNQVCNPKITGGWDLLNKSLNLLSSFNCRTVLRTTCVKDHNMLNPHEYADIIKTTNPDFIEIKAYMFVGSSRDRLTFENMPSNKEVYSFAESIANLCDREIIDSSFESRVVLIS
jgi:tRNA wybutosine-synthesizing protein 1